MLTFLKLVIGVPFVAVCLLLLIGTFFFFYGLKSRADSKALAEYIENLDSKKKNYSSKASIVVIDDYSDFVNDAFAKSAQSDKEPLNLQKERYKRNKLKRSRKRNKIAKASRKQNR